MQVPVEICAEVLKTFPNQRMVSKSLNQYNTQLFCDHYYHTPMTQQEVFDYLLKGNRVVIFKESYVNISVYCIETISYDKGVYHIHHFDCTIVDDYIVFTTHEMMDIGNYKKLSDLIEVEKNMYYDLYTTYNIIEQRKFKATDYLLYELNKHFHLLDDADLYSFFDFVKTMFYFNINKAIFTNDKMVYDKHHMDDIIENHDHVQSLVFINNQFCMTTIKKRFKR